jgi:anti-sigma regulatory factor (Ser/Thr protein kinase)
MSGTGTKRFRPGRGRRESRANARSGVWERNGQAMSGMSVGAETAFNCQIWPADGRWLAAIRAALRGWLAAFALSDELEDDVVLAVNEAASNSIEHAYAPETLNGTVELTLWTEHGSICVEIVDHGEWRYRSCSATYRGRGILIMERLMTLATIHYDGSGTRVLLRLSVPADDGRRLALEAGP